MGKAAAVTSELAKSFQHTSRRQKRKASNVLSDHEQSMSHLMKPLTNTHGGFLFWRCVTCKVNLPLQLLFGMAVMPVSGLISSHV